MLRNCSDIVEINLTDTSRAAEAPLLPGEIPRSDLRDDAEHWTAVYEELVGILRASAPPEGMLERYQLRLDYWRRRREELTAPPLPDGHSSKADA